MTDDQVISKFRMLAQPVLDTVRTERVIVDVMAIEKLTDVSVLAQTLSNQKQR